MSPFVSRSRFVLTDWYWALMRAKTLEGLLSICNEFLASWHPAEVAALPAGCRPGRFLRAEDIKHWLNVLCDRFHSHDHKPVPELTDLITFLFSANDRLDELATPHGMRDGAVRARYAADPLAS